MDPSFEKSAPPASITQRYEALVAAGTIEGDPSQIDLVRRLDALATELGKRQDGNGLFGFARLLGFGNGNGSADAEKRRGLSVPNHSLGVLQPEQQQLAPAAGAPCRNQRRAQARP